MARRWMIAWILAASAFSLAASACDSDDPVERSASADGSTIGVSDYQFEPSILTVEVGDTVSWLWDGAAQHNVVGEGFQSPDQSSGSFEYTFEQPGTYEYACTIHPGMDGSVVVEAARGDASPGHTSADGGVDGSPTFSDGLVPIPARPGTHGVWRSDLFEVLIRCSMGGVPGSGSH